MSEDQEHIDPKIFRSGYVAVVGLPNGGKSTLMNEILNYKISIVSKKPQTTRKTVTGILNGDGHQVVFLDTPGILKPSYSLQRFMLKQVRTAIEDADVLCYVVDAHAPRQSDEDLRVQMESITCPIILVLSKIDLVKDKKLLLPMIARFHQLNLFKTIIPVTAHKNDGVDSLVSEIIDSLPTGMPFYPTDYVSDQHERFFVAEIIREKVYRQYQDEIPYSSHVEIELFEEQEGRKDHIKAIIYLERESQKGILIGKNGAALKFVGETAREEIESFLGRGVFLELFVKISDKWRNRDNEVKRMGYS